MSLVDYAASSDDEDEPQTLTLTLAHEEQNQPVNQNPVKRHRFEAPPPGPPLHSHNKMSTNMGPPSKKQAEIVSDQSSGLKLPDASFLLNSPVFPSNLHNVSDHSSRVAAAMAESAARKRESNGPPASHPRSKLPKGTLPNSKGIPDTVGGHLLPPQLAGRSNVVTEDISKLFVRKHTNPSTG